MSNARAKHVAPASAADAPHERLLPLLLLLFVGSGCAALIYEVLWYQNLSLIVGSNAVSMGVVLGTFMGGMCIGSLLLPRYVSASAHPLRVYAALEAIIGASAVFILYVLPYAGGLYTSVGGPGFAGVLLRGLFCALFLLVPTIAMGATLPAVARWVKATPSGVSWLGFFYAGNIGGAVFGCLLAGFYLLRVHDSEIATWVAFAMNVGVALLALVLANNSAAASATTHADAKNAGGATGATGASATREPLIVMAPGSWPIYAAIALSGATALGAEVIWTRLLALLLGATTYTFSLILAAVLVGLGIGSTLGASLARNARSPQRVLGVLQFGVVAAIGWAAYCETRTLPYWPVNPALAPTPWFQFQIDFVRCLWTVLPAAVLWGASFPLALAAVAPGEKDSGRLVGTVYAANTVGAILGALVASLWMIAHIGTQQSQRVLMALAAIGAVLVFVFARAKEPDGHESNEATTKRDAMRGLGWAAATIALTITMATTVIPVPAILVGYGRYSATWLNSHGDFIFVGEGMNSSMAVSRLESGYLNYHNAGKVQASSEPQDMRLQRMLGHLTTLVPRQSKNVMVIAFGAGVTAGAVSINPDVEHETIVEIEPLVPSTVSTYFGEQNYNVAKNPKVTVKIDDARHYLLTTKEKFDAITSDPFDPWVKGAATLYTKEFFDEAKRHLNPGGVVTVFIQLYESGTAAVKSEVSTFLEAFPNAVVFGNTNGGQGYDIVMLGSPDPLRIDVDALEAKLLRPEFAPVRQSLADIGYFSGTELLQTYAAQGHQLDAWLADAQVNRDRNLRLQYLAGLGVNKYEQASIYAGILSGGKWPDSLFVASPERLMTLRAGAMRPRY
ncbi:MAG: fused MFS/spermidine synthase [Gemmatimonadetes bacterium]|nr:fused MFS/spermidine synthase [Gemmatimonadota bacterium]